MTRVSPRWIWVVCLALCWTAPAAAAQAGSVELTGQVLDQDGAAVPGAIVTITRGATNQARTLVTNDEGYYTGTGLVPGEYEVSVERAGFRPLLRRGLHLETGETARVDLTISVGTVSETVTVTADTPILNTGRATLGQVIDQERIVKLPLNGRTFVSLVALAPGVALPPGSQLPRINGGRPRVNEYRRPHVAVRRPDSRDTVDELQRVCRLRRATPESGWRSRITGGSARPKPLVRYQRVRHCAAVHDRFQSSQPGARAGLPAARPGPHSPRAHGCRHRPRAPRRSLQRHEHTALGKPEWRVRHGIVRDDHIGGRPAGRPTGAQVALLIR